MEALRVWQMTCTRIPTDAGEFQLCLYRTNWDEKEHLALICGEIRGGENVLVRVHSECFTGDVIGSRRCDCGEQLKHSIELVAAEGQGVIIYLRQEGRGIGLLNKLRAYNLQDEGYDTVDANLMLGHEADERDYTVAAHILRELDVRSIKLLTNNPGKIESLTALGIPVTGRLSLLPSINQDNAAYLTTKAERMRHLLDPAKLQPTQPRNNGEAPWFLPAISPGPSPENRPFVTLSYAQSLNGAITVRRGENTVLSNNQSMALTHRLRAAHQAILVGIGTALADDPRLTTRLVPGQNPQPVVVDSALRLSPAARLMAEPPLPWIAATEDASRENEAALTAAGARVIRLPATAEGKVALPALLRWLKNAGIDSLMVEGGAAIITSFLAERLVDRLVVTISPQIMNGLNVIQATLPSLPRLEARHSQWLGDDIIWWGDVQWAER